MLTISVIGLGYVGVVCAACQADEGHSVIGVDTDKKKLKKLMKVELLLWSGVLMI